MQMLSSFPVSDKALLGRSGFAASEISQPGLHLIQEAQLDICWEVAVSNPEKGHCSGVLLTSQHVLTAAHCVTE
jgi:Trypsin